MQFFVVATAFLSTLFVLSAALAWLWPALFASDNPDSVVAYAAIGLVFVISGISGYVAGNVVEGVSLSDIRKKLFGSALSVALVLTTLFVIALAVWFLFSTPIWALVIIVLLILILLK